MMTAIKRQFVITKNFQNRIEFYSPFILSLLCMFDGFNAYTYGHYIIVSVFSFLSGMFFQIGINKIKSRKNASLKPKIDKWTQQP